MHRLQLASAPSQAGCLYDAEAAWKVIHDYVQGSFEQNTWIVHKSGYATSIIGGNTRFPRLLLPFESVKAAPSLSDVQAAMLQMGVLCHEAKWAISIQDPVYFLDSFLVYLEVFASDGDHKDGAIHFHHILMRHQAKMAKTVHNGIVHP
jgi:hypothetical protein